MPQEDMSQMPEGTPRRRWRYVLGAVLLLLAGVIAAPFIYLSQAGGFAGLLQTQLSERLGGAPVVVGDVGVGLRLPSMFFTLEAYDVEISLDDGVILVPQVSAEFSPQSLLKADPSEVVLSGLDVDLTMSPDGWKQSKAAGLFAAMASRQRNDGDSKGIPRQVRIDNAGLNLRQPGAGGAVLRFGPVAPPGCGPFAAPPGKTTEVGRSNDG